MFFFLYSVLWQWFPSLCLPAHLFVVLLHLFLYWFLLVYFSYCIVHLFLSFKSHCFLNISCIILICVSILFLRSWIIFTIITINYFSGRLPISSSFSCSCGFLSFSLICTNFSVISFHLTYCVCGLLSTGCRIIVPLASGVCPLVGEVGPGPSAGFLVGWAGACPLLGGAGAMSKGVFWGGCEISTTLGSLSSVGWG